MCGVNAILYVFVYVYEEKKTRKPFLRLFNYHFSFAGICLFLSGCTLFKDHFFLVEIKFAEIYNILVYPLQRTDAASFQFHIRIQLRLVNVIIFYRVTLFDFK